MARSLETLGAEVADHVREMLSRILGPSAARRHLARALSHQAIREAELLRRRAGAPRPPPSVPPSRRGKVVRHVR